MSAIAIAGQEQRRRCDFVWNWFDTNTRYKKQVSILLLKPAGKVED
jgi:hypothetical protein